MRSAESSHIHVAMCSATIDSYDGHRPPDTVIYVYAHTHTYSYHYDNFGADDQPLLQILYIK